MKTILEICLKVIIGHKHVWTNRCSISDIKVASWSLSQ